MKRIFILILILIVSVLSLGFASCDEAEVETEVEPYIIATFFPSCDRDVNGYYYSTGNLGAVITIRCETPNLDGWYITYSADNVDKIRIIENEGKYEAYTDDEYGSSYITVIYTNGVDKVTDIIRGFYDDGNYDIDVFFRSYSGLDKTEMSNKWQLSLDTPVELTPNLFYRNKSFDDAIIESITVEDESILSYENGVLTPLKTGTTKIIIDCSWRGYTYTSWDNGGKRDGTGSADLRREVVVTVS